MAVFRRRHLVNPRDRVSAVMGSNRACFCLADHAGQELFAWCDLNHIQQIIPLLQLNHRSDTHLSRGSARGPGGAGTGGIHAPWRSGHGNLANEHLDRNQHLQAKVS